jgi:hypothetical protein
MEWEGEAPAADLEGRWRWKPAADRSSGQRGEEDTDRGEERGMLSSAGGILASPPTSGWPPPLLRSTDFFQSVSANPSRQAFPRDAA